MTENKKYSALMNLESSVKNSAELENNRYKNQSALRSPHEDNAELFNRIGNNVSAPGQRPRGIGANIAAGIFHGLGHSEMAKSTAEKKGNFEKYAKQTDYLQQVQAEALKQNQWHEQEERRMETVKPFAVGGLEIAYSDMDYNTGNERMRNVIEQAKLADPRIKGDYIGYVPNSPIINMRNENGEIVAFSLSNLVGEDITKRVQENYINTQKMKTEKQFAPIKYAAMERRMDGTEERTRQMAQRTYEKSKEKYAPKIEAAAKVQVITNKMEKLIKDNPGVFLDVYNAVWDSNEEEPSALRLIMQNVTNGKTAEAIKELGKSIQELKIGSIKGLSNPNMFADKVVAGTIPGRGMPDASALRILKDINEKAKYEMELNKEYLNDIKGAHDQKFDGGDKYAGMAEDYVEKQTGTPQTPPGNSVTIVNPETGEEKTIPENYLDSAVSGGWYKKEQ